MDGLKKSLVVKESIFNKMVWNKIYNDLEVMELSKAKDRYMKQMAETIKVKGHYMQQMSETMEQMAETIFKMSETMEKDCGMRERDH